jgi:SAM-dependent methyltransferase
MNNTITQTNFEASRLVYREYDDYLTSKKATTSYLRLEEEIILNQIRRLLPDNMQLGIDLGCGTGRISILINEYFKKLISFDISEEMLSIAKEKSYTNKPEFIQHNFNLGIEDFFDPDLHPSFICASFGVGSCIENLEWFLDRAIKMLNKDGIIILSFYNRNYNAFTSNKKDLPFSSMLNAKEDLVIVNHPSAYIPIKIHSYTHQELQSIVEKYAFTHSDFYFLPTLSGLIKSDLLQDHDFFERIISLDKSLLQYANTVSAPYILLALTK